MTEQTVKIGEAAAILGLHPETLRRWDRDGILEVGRNYLGHRLYSLSKILEVKRRLEGPAPKGNNADCSLRSAKSSYWVGSI